MNIHAQMIVNVQRTTSFYVLVWAYMNVLHEPELPTGWHKKDLVAIIRTMEYLLQKLEFETEYGLYDPSPNGTAGGVHLDQSHRLRTYMSG